MLTERITKAVRRSLNKLGFDLTRYRSVDSNAGRLALMLRINAIDLVLDVGANTGQFARSLRLAGYSGRIVSFEPLVSAHLELERASKRDAKWTVAPRCALGAFSGEVNFYVAGNSQSSSALEMLQSHIDAAPHTKVKEMTRVPLRTLDQFADSYLMLSSRVFLKIDTQGYEDQVLLGASQSMPSIRGIQMELSLTPLYENQKLFAELFVHVCDLGFNSWSISPGFGNGETGRMLQVDATFFRPE